MKDRAQRGRSAAAMRPPIALLTDFGYRDHYVGVMKGVIASIAPEARVIDITHGIAPQSIIGGAIALRESWKFFPPRTIFVVVVDPGVGTERRPIAVETHAGARFVGPDNGVMALALDQAGFARAVELTAQRYRLPRVSASFHGRDIFAPAAAYLWRGTRLAAMGPAVTNPIALELPRPLETASELRGEVIYVDGFGNLITNIGREMIAEFATRFPTTELSVRIGRGGPMKILEAYGKARKGTPLAIPGSFGTLEIAVRDANAAHRFDAGVGARVSVRPRRQSTNG